MPLIATITDNKIAFMGSLTHGTRRVQIQHRPDADSPWTPPLGTTAAISPSRAKDLLSIGPWKYTQYKLTEVTPAEKEPPIDEHRHVDADDDHSDRTWGNVPCDRKRRA